MSALAWENLLVLLLVAVVCGWLAGIVTKGSGFGLIGNIAVAMAGALIGVYLFGAVGVGGPLGAVAVGMLGAFSLLALIGRLRR
jgi:uncharacterized membrane protein YeaQ/YmgE (transglycosylase-associated protein family)